MKKQVSEFHGFKVLRLRNATCVFLCLTLVAFVACDPGMTIRQKDELTRGESSSELVVRVAARDQFIGETRYITKVEVTNISISRIVITAVELVTSRETYPNHPFAAGAYPLTLIAGGAETLDVRFELAEPVHKAFIQPAKLQLHYKIGNQEETAHATIVGASLR